MNVNIKYAIYSVLYFIAGIGLHTSCKSANGQVNCDSKLKISYLDSAKASIEIATDKYDGFFNKIHANEIAIQMKSERGFSDDLSARLAYKTFLKTQVSTFLANEKLMIDSLFIIAKSKIGALNCGVLPDKINIVKIKNGHYGNDVYYTRGNTIFIPENIFDNFVAETQLPVMIHEIWHIMSRTNASLREKAYALIGFKQHGMNLMIDPSLEKRRLYNPDGVTDDYALKIGDLWVMPIITANSTKYSKDNPSFFDYLKFDLYDINQDGIMDTEPLNLNLTNEFFKEIKDNTQYIIHPDEILADNFMLAVLAYSKNDYEEFSKEGKVLIENVIKLIKNQP
jgi:hypothetical protein